MNDSCGCCEAPVSPTPELITNRPGLSAIVYRVGTYASFRQAMVEAIAQSRVKVGGQELRPLQAWTARQDDDYGIALLDMWAYLGDILTFYQERLANEAYLNTAVMREDVLRLAALLGYKPANGVAASAYLAFTVQKGKSVAITPGMRIQSVPGQGEKPQKFETMESITARSVLSKFRVYPRPDTANPLVKDSQFGTLAPNDADLIAEALSPGDKFVIFSRGTAVFNPAASGSGRSFAAVENAQSYLDKYGLTNAPNKIESVAAGSKQMQMIRFFDPAVDTWMTATGRRREIGEQLLLRVMRRVAGNPTVSPEGVEEKEVEAVETVDWRTELSWTPAVQASGWSLGGAQVYKWLRKLRLFGYDAPKRYMKSSPTAGELIVNWAQVKEGDKSYKFNLPSGTTLTLDALYDDMKVGTQILIATPDFTQLTQIKEAAQVKTEKGPLEDTVTQITLVDSFQAISTLREVVIYELVGPEITFWAKAYSEKISGSDVYVPLVEWDYNTGDYDFDAEEVEALLEPDRHIILQDEDGQVQATTVEAAQVVGDHLRITLAESLAKSVDADTAVAHANVVEVTHGETVAGEVLGSGDAANEFQSFTLKKAPVTYISEAGAENGAANTLEVRVDELLWHEVNNFYGQATDARVFTTHVDDDSNMTVQFGNGETGARLSTGINNVVATYRQGIGQDGNVDTATLTTLLDKPVGLKESTNPLPAEGGAESESIKEARKNSPNTVRTFERIVSLRDFEDAARAYAGIAKARAAWRWEGLQQAVCLTVAGDKGAQIKAGGSMHKKLVADLDSRRDPNRKMMVGTYHPVPVKVAAAIEVDSDYVEEDVQADARQALIGYFDFDNLDLGHPIHLSDLYRVLQDVDGVVAVDINLLRFKEPKDRLSHGETAVQPQPHLAIFAAELATLASATIDLMVPVGID